MQCGETNSGIVISGDMILKWKLIWSQVAAGLRSPFRQKEPTEDRRNAACCNCFSHTLPGVAQPPGFL